MASAPGLTCEILTCYLERHSQHFTCLPEAFDDHFTNRAIHQGQFAIFIENRIIKLVAVFVNHLLSVLVTTFFFVFVTIKDSTFGFLFGFESLKFFDGVEVIEFTET